MNNGFLWSLGLSAVAGFCSMIVFSYHGVRLPGKILIWIGFVAMYVAGSIPAHAETRVGVHIGSVHIPNRDQNNFNPGVFVRHDSWVGGVYHNSVRKPSWYAGHIWNVSGPVDFTAGLVTGYPKGTVLPLGALSLRLGDHARLVFMPPVDKNSGVVHLTWEF